MESLAPTVYPSMISRACSALDESHLFKDMPDGFFRIILRIIKKIDLSCPKSAIFASRGTIAAESGKSVETVQRAVRWLEDRGLIEREQKANPGHRGSKSPLKPTEALLATLGLLDSQTSPVNGSGGSVFQPRRPVKAQIGRSEAAKSPFVRVGNITLPGDLAWLCTSNGVPASGVLLLMKKAKAAKQLLSDVVTATKGYLSNLTGRELFAYLNALLSKGKDFAQISRDVAEKENIAETSQYLTEKAELMEGRTFSNKDGSVRVTVEGGMLSILKHGKRAVAYMSQQFLDGIDAGRLRAHWGRREAY